MSVGFTLHFKTKEGMEGEFEEFLSGMVKVVTENDAGCEQYELFRGVTNPRNFSFIERWATSADVEAHSKQPHFKEFEKMEDMLERPPDMMRHMED